MSLWGGGIAAARASSDQPARPEVIEADGHGEVLVPGADFIVHAEYTRVGRDLVLAGDGRRVVIHGFSDYRKFRVRAMTMEAQETSHGTTQATDDSRRDT